jgi:AraC family transcriptional regulator of arabinose operon
MSAAPATRSRPQKGEGFPGQRIVVLPRSVLARAARHPLMGGLLPTDVGCFPMARGHLRERITGVDPAIFIFCSKGRGWCEIGGARHEIQPGEMLVIPPGTPHTYGADEARPWSIHWFHAQGTLLGDFLRALEIGPDQLVFRLTETTQLLALFEEVLDVVEHGYTTQQLLCASQALAHLMAVLIREHRSPDHEQPVAAQRIARTVAYMKQHLHQPLQLDALAAIANLSRSRYVELFKQQAGYAPIDYFIRLRMHRACQLLDTTDASIKEVAARLGYEDPLYFSRVFRAVNDQTPTEYRKLRKG